MTASRLNTASRASGLPAFLQDDGQIETLLRAMDWSRHPLGEPTAWSAALQTVVAIILRSRQPMFVSWGPDLHTVYNAGYAQICANRHPAGLGAKLQDIWPEIWDSVEPLMTRAYSGESIQNDDFTVMLHRNGAPEAAHFTFSYTPVRDETGAVTGVFCVCEETTKQTILSRELSQQRLQLAQMFQDSPSFIVQLSGPEHVIEFANPAYMKLVGHRDILGKSVAGALPELNGQGYIEMLDSVLLTGRPVSIEASKVVLQRHPDSALEDRFIDFVYQPVLDASGNVTGVFANGVDVTDRISAAAELCASEQLLRSVLAASSDCIKVLSLDGRLIYMSNGGRLVMEVPTEAQIEGRLWSDLWGPPFNCEAIRALDAARTGENTAFQGYAETFAGNRRFWDVRVTPMLDLTGRPDRILVVSRDISYLKKVEEEREHLAQELSHRLKNAFSMVQSVIGQTLRRATSLEEGRRVLSDRVRALASAQDILTQSHENAMPIDAVIAAALLPHDTGDGRYTISGPPATISGRQGLGLSLALHELATNATKYGAISTSDGRVGVRWDVSADGGFSFSWTETGGPSASPPTAQGFGTVLIEQIVATYFDGAATLEFPKSGAVFRLLGNISCTDTAEAPHPY